MKFVISHVDDAPFSYVFGQIIVFNFRGKDIFDFTSRWEGKFCRLQLEKSAIDFE